mmetsp:Transcript_30752/g.53157  ORF Transcript_30752/g.53157 Transcript_30752/m.53157 type:complete len:92 (+) Transcript_30752:246-521(+)
MGARPAWAQQRQRCNNEMPAGLLHVSTGGFLRCTPLTAVFWGAKEVRPALVPFREDLSFSWLARGWDDERQHNNMYELPWMSPSGQFFWHT